MIQGEVFIGGNNHVINLWPRDSFPSYKYLPRTSTRSQFPVRLSCIHIVKRPRVKPVISSKIEKNRSKLYSLIQPKQQTGEISYRGCRGTWQDLLLEESSKPADKLHVQEKRTPLPPQGICHITSWQPTGRPDATNANCLSINKGQTGSTATQAGRICAAYVPSASATGPRRAEQRQ